MRCDGSASPARPSGAGVSDCDRSGPSEAPRGRNPALDGPSAQATARAYPSAAAAGVRVRVLACAATPIASRTCRVTRKRDQRASQRLRVARIDDEAGPALLHEIERGAAERRSDERKAARRRLEQHDAERVVERREREGVRRFVDGRQSGLVDKAEELDRLDEAERPPSAHEVPLPRAPSRRPRAGSPVLLRGRRPRRAGADRRPCGV